MNLIIKHQYEILNNVIDAAITLSKCLLKYLFFNWHILRYNVKDKFNLFKSAMYVFKLYNCYILLQCCDLAWSYIYLLAT